MYLASVLHSTMRLHHIAICWLPLCTRIFHIIY